MDIGILWADWVRAAGASPNDIIFTKIAWKFNIEERRHIGFHHFQLSKPHYQLDFNLEEVPISDYIGISCNYVPIDWILPVRSDRIK